jgi:hypothetical protein
MASCGLFERFGADEVMEALLSYASGLELLCLAKTSKAMFEFVIHAKALWRAAVGQHGILTRADVARDDITGAKEMISAFRRKHAMQNLAKVRWTRGTVVGEGMRGQEGHAAALLNERYLVVVCGFGG